MRMESHDVNTVIDMMGGAPEDHGLPDVEAEEVE